MLPMVIVPAQGEVLPYPDPAEREARGPAACMARQISINATLAGGTDGSNPSPSGGESGANQHSLNCVDYVADCIALDQ